MAGGGSDDPVGCVTSVGNCQRLQRRLCIVLLFICAMHAALPEPSPKFPHTRAQLAAIARQYRPLDNYEPDEDLKLVPSALLQSAVSLLVDENEDGLRTLLRGSFAIDDDMVGVSYLARCLCSSSAA